MSTTTRSAEETLTAAQLRELAAWKALKQAATEFQLIQVQDGSVPEAKDKETAKQLSVTIQESIAELAPHFAHDAQYLTRLYDAFASWQEADFEVPDFLEALQAFQPQQHRADGLRHLVIFPMYTQNGSSNRFVEAVLIEVIWPEFIDELETGEYSNALFLPIRFIDFTPGYDTNSAVLFPESVAVSQTPQFTWGAIFADREAARFRRVLRSAADITRLDLPEDAAALLDDQHLTESTFVMWDLIHDRTHMRGDLPFDPFMIKQRMPFFLYTLEELRCDLTAFRESVKIEKDENASPEARTHAKLVQYAVIFDRIFRFAMTGTRVRNYDGLGGQLLFAWMHQHRVLHWTDTKLTIDWENAAQVVIALGQEIEDLYWRSIDRPKTAHWLAAYELISTTVTPHPASTWAKGPEALPVDGPPRGLTDLVLADEFPHSMFYEALEKKMRDVIASTSGITGETASELTAA